MSISFKLVNKLAIFSVIAFILFAGYAATAKAEGPEVDPIKTPTMTLTCNYNLEREDGTPMVIGEVAQVNFFVSQSLTTPDWQPAGSNNTECKQVYNLTDVPNGQYYYTGKQIDTDARQSIYGSDAVPPEYFAMVVKRLANPKPQTGYGATFN